MVLLCYLVHILIILDRCFVFANVYLVLIDKLFKNNSRVLPNSSAAFRKVCFVFVIVAKLEFLASDGDHGF